MKLTPVPYTAMERFLPSMFMDYVARKESVKSAWSILFNSVEPIARYAGQISRTLPADVVKPWTTYLQEHKAPDESLAALEKLGAGATCVVTGQQPGLFGGPAYNLYKALTAIKVARRVEEATGRPCVPVFWNHSDDHSLDEFSTLGLPSENGAMELSIEFDSAAPAYLYNGSWVYPKLLERIAVTTLIPQPVLDVLVETYQGTASAGFSRLLLRTLGRFGLVPVEPRVLQGETARRLYTDCLSSPDGVRAALERGSKRVEASGHEPKLRGVSGTGVFRIKDGLREKVISSRAVFTAGTQTQTLDELLGERLSPQVFLRPILQDAVLPSCAYVGGPNEIAYLAELKELYDHFDVPQPAVVPRMSATVIQGGIARSFEKLGIGFDKSFMNREGLQEEVMRAASGSVLEGIDALSDGVGKGVDTLTPGLLEVDKTLDSAVQKTKANMERIFSGLRSRVIKASEARKGVQATRLGKILSAVRPQADLQERRIGQIAFLDGDLPARVLESCDPFDLSHQFVELDSGE